MGSLNKIHRLVGLHRFYASRNLDSLEQRVMDALWRLDNATARELLSESDFNLPPTTLQTALDRLYKKDVVDRVVEGSNRTFRYSPRYSQNELRRIIATDNIGQFLYLGDSDPRPVLAYLVDAIAERDAALLDQLNYLVDAKRQELSMRDTQLAS
jgi:predicted transcriptional regulator